MTEDVLRGLTTDYPDNIPVDKLRAAMTEVGLDALGNEAVDVFEHGDFLMPGAYLLAHIKEGDDGYKED